MEADNPNEGKTSVFTEVRINRKASLFTKVSINDAEPKAASKTLFDDTEPSSTKDEDVVPIVMTSYAILERQATYMADHPCTYLWVALLISFTLSVVGMVVGDFTVSVDNTGWRSRGTEIADRHSQLVVALLNRDKLFEDKSGAVWDHLINNVQPGWETDEGKVDYRRLVETTPGTLALDEKAISRHLELQKATKPAWELTSDSEERRLPFLMTPSFDRKLQSATNSSLLEGCDVDWYYYNMTVHAHLWPIWHPKDVSEPNTLLNQNVLRDLCLSEGNTQRVLLDNGLCYGCSDVNRCLPPYSIVFLARLTVTNGMELDCEQLSAAWVDYNNQNKKMGQDLHECVSGSVDSCPTYFHPVLVDEYYGATAAVQYTSSIFASKNSRDDIYALYDNVGKFSRGTDLIEGTYDTQWEDFVNIEVDNALLSDMALASMSSVLTLMAILVHTRSPFLSMMGLLQIIMSFPLAFFLYSIVGQLDFFPFLNFIGLFIVFALGSDDVFVAVDKWKNARLEEGMDATTAVVAAKALPDAAGAMFLTSFTTAVAFFATAVSTVAPIRCFAIFVGLLVTCDYIMCVLLVFPALCIYDQRRHVNSCFCRCHCCRSTEGGDDEGSDQKLSLIHRILTRFYSILHRTRYFLLLCCFVVFVLCAIVASTMGLPESSDVRLLSEDHEFEKNNEWRSNLLSAALLKREGSAAYVVWGTTPADTGDRNNPASFTQLVLDHTFEPSKTEAQVYLRDFCDKFFKNEWADPFGEEACPINRFDEWLQEQANTNSPDQIYVDHCGGATRLPLSENDFDTCVYNWSQHVDEPSFLARNGKVEIMYFKFKTRVRYDSSHDVLDDEWHTIEDWMANERRTAAPESVAGMFFTSEDFWWYDTNGGMLETAYVSAAITICVCGAVILLSSRSIVLTFLSTFTIGYVLASVTAILVALGWTLGFLESICFAILIGISCDFVIHFSHAYASPPGNVDRHTRTKYALIHMGPSILAGAFTTIAAASIMLFTTITFFSKFAMILFMTILQSTVGSFVVFLVLADSIGPSQPTYVCDWLTDMFCKKKWR